MPLKTINPGVIAPPVGAYSQGVLAPNAGHWLHIAGQVGIGPDGVLADGFAAQAKTAWQNLMAVLHDAQMDVSHLVKVCTYLVDADHLKLLNAVRAPFLGDARPASTVVVVKALARSEWLVEVDAVAYRG
jgi:enamine deaminase RidA (YjgF/YER057c/UK114 family)